MDFTLLESVPDAMIIVDGGGRIVYVNCVTETLFGYARGELVGQSIEALLPARLRDGHRGQREAYEAAPRTRHMGAAGDLVALTKNGEEFTADISLAPMEAGSERYVVAAVRDITERKKVEQRARLFRKAQEEVRRRDEFLSVASHELRTPVTALQLQLQMLQRMAERDDGELSPSLRQKIESLERQTHRIARLVNELLDLSRMHLGRFELKLDEIDLAQLAHEAVEQLRDQAERSGSKLTVKAAMPVVGRWDRLRIEQVVTNLLANAVKFGEGKPIAVSVEADPNRARVSIEDNGIGIAPEDQARIFSRFERAVPAEHFGGLGLGLYIAHQIVEAHGGAILLRSAPGSGSTFTVDLPRSPPIQAAAAGTGGAS